MNEIPKKMSGYVTRPLIDPTTLEAHPHDPAMNRVMERRINSGCKKGNAW